MHLQKTLKHPVTVKGIGLHSGEPCFLHFAPAPPGFGIHFVRTDLPGRPTLQVSSTNVQATSYATTLGGALFSVATVEHCLSALSALRIDNLFIELDGPEIPITDGSAKHFVEALRRSGLVEQDQVRKYCFIRQNISIQDGDKWAKLSPYMGLRLSVTIDFPHVKIGRQSLDMDINEETFVREIASARTFGFLKDVEMLHKQGLALGGSLQNAIVLSDDDILNPEGLRYENEFVRHKMLDALGDLVILGMPLMGHLELHKAGHDLMNQLVKALLAAPDTYRYVELGTPTAEWQTHNFGGSFT